MNYYINESKRGLNSKKLYQIAKEHGGLSPRHGYNFKRFNELTDNDVIGVVDNAELNRYKEASYKVRQEWAISKGFTVNKGDDVTFIPMNDWTWVAVIVRGDMLPDREWAETPYGKKRIERNRNKTHDGAKNYVWSDSNTDKEKGLIGWSKRANEFNRMKFNNEINENNNMKIKLTESKLKQIVMESVKKVLNETDYHKAYKSAKKLDGFGLGDAITEDEVFECLDILQKRLEQERKNASTGQFTGTGESINYLVASIRGLQAFIKSRY